MWLDECHCLDERSPVKDAVVSTIDIGAHVPDEVLVDHLSSSHALEECLEIDANKCLLRVLERRKLCKAFELREEPENVVSIEASTD